MFLFEEAYSTNCISPKIDILSRSRTQTQVSKMLLTLLTFVSWFALGGYTAWYFSKARELHPLTIEELAILWKIHKNENACVSTTVQKIVHKDKIVGFECDCGYRYVSKRPISQKPLRRFR